MSLSPSSFEILSDLLELRLESFLVTSSEEARELKMLRHCQHELSYLQNIGRKMLAAAAPKAPEAAEKPKISRRLQRLVKDLNQAEEAARAIA